MKAGRRLTMTMDHRHEVVTFSSVLVNSYFQNARYMLSDS